MPWQSMWQASWRLQHHKLLGRFHLLHPLHEPSSESSTSSSSQGASPAPIGAEDEPAFLWHWPSHILGQPVRADMKCDGSMGTRDACDNLTHGQTCRKHRSFQGDMDVFGRLTAVGRSTRSGHLRGNNETPNASGTAMLHIVTRVEKRLQFVRDLQLDNAEEIGTAVLTVEAPDYAPDACCSPIKSSQTPPCSGALRHGAQTRQPLPLPFPHPRVRGKSREPPLGRRQQQKCTRPK